MAVPSVELPTGDVMPTVGLGTGGLESERVRETVHTAIEAGYTHVDTAEAYGNEAAIGEAIAEHDRDELFLTSKVLPSNLDYESVIESCAASIDRLGVEYLDLYLVHWPNPAISLRETLHAMERLVDRGLVRNVGVSNFDAYHLSAAQHVSGVPISVNQIEFHPWLQRPELIEYCREADVVVEAAAPLARTGVFDEDAVRALADEYDRSPAQVVLRWAVEKGVAVIPKSTSPEHLRENLEFFDWSLDEADRRRLDELDRDQSVYHLSETDWTDDTYGIAP